MKKFSWVAVFMIIFFGTIATFFVRAAFVANAPKTIPMQNLLLFALAMSVLFTPFLRYIWFLYSQALPSTIALVREYFPIKPEAASTRSVITRHPPSPIYTSPPVGDLAFATRQRQAAAPEVKVSQPLPTVLPPAIIDASKQAIVFRQDFPPRHDPKWLSFFGGLPIASSDLIWPSSNDARGTTKPLSFLMQVDCATIPPEGRLGLMPDQGTIYIFIDFEWGGSYASRVLYEEQREAGLMEHSPPADLPNLFGTEAKWIWDWVHVPSDIPKTLTKWTFQPVVIQASPRDEDMFDDDGSACPFYWNGAGTSEFVRAQGQPTVYHAYRPEKIDKLPFANFPQDWQAVRIFAGFILRYASRSRNQKSFDPQKQLTDENLVARIESVKLEARKWLNHALARPAFDAVPANACRAFWTWLNQVEISIIASSFFSKAEALSVDASLTASAEAGKRLPLDYVSQFHTKHALARQAQDGQIYTSDSERMLSAPSFVQGSEDERAKTHLLFLEISSNEALDHHFGEGVYQFWITPEDLKARRFSKVVMTADAT
jgi:uncharacterized protein YwqG